MHTFIKQESGAVTVDWVVLTAALVGLGLATMAVVSSGVEDTSGDIKSELLRDDIITASFGTDAFAPARTISEDGTIVGHVSNGLIATWIEDRSNPDNYTDEQIASSYLDAIDSLDQAKLDNNTASLESSIVWMGVYEEAMVARGMTPPETATTDYSTERDIYDGV